MLEAIELGTRRWDDDENSNKTSVEKQAYQSFFVPYKCDVPPLTSSEMCQIFSSFQHVVSWGDSLSRHMHMGFMMGLKHDFCSGGHISNSMSTYANCKCDGQFSEHAICREYSPLFWKFDNSHELGVCSQQAPFHLSQPDTRAFHEHGPQVIEDIPWKDIDCDDENYRGLLYITEAGPHQNFVMPAVTRKFGYMFKDPRLQACIDKGKAHVIWIQAGAQSRAMDNLYPRQSRECTRVFNEEMASWFHTNGVNVTVLNFWNLTADAQTSDGFHNLLDVNLMKAFYVLRVAQMLKQQGKQ
jgi:hypothetical protein